MNVTGISAESLVGLSDQWLSYANMQGIHLFQPEDTRRNLAIIGNPDQSLVTLVFSVGGECRHLTLHKWFWYIPVVRWVILWWLISD